MSFSADLRKFCHTEAPEKTNRIVRAVVIEIANRVVYRSPVGNPELWLAKDGDTYVDYLSVYGDAGGYVGGRFRGNWQHTLGIPALGEVDRVDKSGRETLSSIKNSIALNPAGGIHWIVNNLPYAERIETGWSTQAPQGVVALTELEFPQIVKRVIG